MVEILLIIKTGQVCKLEKIYNYSFKFKKRYFIRRIKYGTSILKSQISSLIMENTLIKISKQFIEFAKILF